MNTLNGIMLATLYSAFMQANLAFTLGYISTLLIAYILNSLFVFKMKPNLSKMFKFVISYTPNFILQSIVVFVVYNIMRLWAMVAYITAAIIGIPVTFLILKLFTFKGEETDERNKFSK